MLIVYNRSTGEVVDNTGTNSSFPEGPEEPECWRNVDDRGLDRSDYALLRLHDEENADLVELALTHECSVDVSSKELVIGHPLVPVTSEPEVTPEQKRLSQLEAAVDQLILDQLMGG